MELVKKLKKFVIVRESTYNCRVIDYEEYDRIKGSIEPDFGFYEPKSKPYYSVESTPDEGVTVGYTTTSGTGNVIIGATAGTTATNWVYSGFYGTTSDDYTTNIWSGSTTGIQSHSKPSFPRVMNVATSNSR